MSSDAEIWRAARDLITDHGGAVRAERHAMKQVDEMFSTGNFVGHLLWRRILKAIRGMNRQGPAAAAAGRARR